ncbi:MAG: hypothetical protein ACO1OD_07010 [Croceibacterium sp.]
MNRSIAAALSILAWLAASCSQQQEAAAPDAAQEAAPVAEDATETAPLPTAGPLGRSVPVMAGGDAQLDACATAAVVSGLDPAGDNFLSVREGPGQNHAETDRLAGGQGLAVCDSNGPWLGVIYSKDGADCEVSSPASQRTRYQGPCRSGWVAARYVTITAG